MKILLDLPVDVYGRGWDHLKQQAGQARFHDAVDASFLSSIYADTQFLLNTSPNVGSGIHERVAYGLGARCFVISDQNDFSEQYLQNIPTFNGVDFFDQDARDCIHSLYYSKADYTGMTDVGVEYIERNLSAQEMMLSLIAIAEELRFSENMF